MSSFSLVSILFVLGDIVVIHGQTIDGVYYNVVNLRTNQEGEVPCQTITLGMDVGTLTLYLYECDVTPCMLLLSMRCNLYPEAGMGDMMSKAFCTGQV